MAKREKKPVHKVIMTEGKRNIIQQLLQEYDIETAEDIQDALKDLLGGTIKEMMDTEMDEHQRSVFPSDTALLKSLYLAYFEATKKWTTTIRNWAQVYGELSIMYEGRLPE